MTKPTWIVYHSHHSGFRQLAANLNIPRYILFAVKSVPYLLKARVYYYSHSAATFRGEQTQPSLSNRRRRCSATLLHHIVTTQHHATTATPCDVFKPARDGETNAAPAQRNNGCHETGSSSSPVTVVFAKYALDAAKYRPRAWHGRCPRAKNCIPLQPYQCHTSKL